MDVRMMLLMQGLVLYRHRPMGGKIHQPHFFVIFTQILHTTVARLDPVLLLDQVGFHTANLFGYIGWKKEGLGHLTMNTTDLIDTVMHIGCKIFEDKLQENVKSANIW
jgi:hypothetical protein